MKKRILLGRVLPGLVLLFVAMAVAVPYLPAGVFRARIEQALEGGLGRKVEVGDVRFTFFPGVFPSPGFTLERVTIHEDPRAGIEPFAYMNEVGASVRLLGLLSRKFEFSSLNLGDATINLVKTDAGEWNFQLLLERAGETEAAMPAVRMRGGRVNFKFGDTKSVFYFNDADLDVAHGSNGALDLRFGGAPSRTDRSAQDFGRFFVSGTSAAEHRRLDLRVELQRSSLEETLRLIDPLGFGVHGAVALEARLNGPPERLNIEGSLQVDDIHRWDLLPKEGGGWQVGFHGFMDLGAERLDLESTRAKAGEPEPPVVMRFRVWDYLKDPLWDAGADFREVPLATLFEIGRHMGWSPPENLTVGGSMSGSAAFNQREGISGRVTLSDATLTLPDEEPLRAPEAQIEIGGGAVRMAPAVVHIGETQSAEVRGSYTLAAPRALDVRIAAQGLSVASMRSFGLAAIPVIEQTPQGTWEGWARYRNQDVQGNPREEWTGESKLRDARIQIDGLAAPVEIESAAVSLSGRGVAVNDVKASAGGVAFTGSYRWEPAAARPHKFSVVLGEVDAAALEGLLEPALSRQRGFLARTLGLGSAPPAPAWLRARRADGVVAIESLAAGRWTARALKTRLLWDGTQVRLANLGGLLDPAAFSGDLRVDLGGAAPRYHFDGELTGVPYSGGHVDLMGTLDAEGPAAQWIESARAAGSLRGRTVAFAPEADFRNVGACFQIQAAGGGPRWRFYDVEATQAGAPTGERLVGTGVSQADGRVLLELSQGERQVRYTGSLFAMGGKQ